MGVNPLKIYVSNKSTVLPDSEVQSALPAFQRQCWHVKSWWGAFATLVFTDSPPAESWQIVVLDDSDQAGALGYHDFTPGGRPISKIFANTDKKYGYNWTVTFSHELCEMLCDPWISAAYQTDNDKFYALEVGDPVEADEFGYAIKITGYPSITVSDFAIPNWFIPGAPGPYDYRKHCTQPLQVLVGGYAQYYSGGGWHQVNAQGAEMALEDSARFRDRSKK